MPPRVPGPQGLRALTLCLRPAPKPLAASLQPLIQTASLSRKEKKRRMKQDPYGWAQAQQRKAAHEKKQEALKREREALMGSPIHGIPTPFVESFDTAGQAATPSKGDGSDAAGSDVSTDASGAAAAATTTTTTTTTTTATTTTATATHLRSHMLSDAEVDEAIRQSYNLTKPQEASIRTSIDPQLEAQERAEHEEHHRKAVEVLRRITDLSQGAAVHRRQANIKRCIDTFGRHHTDRLFAHPGPLPAVGVQPTPKPPRAGPDTGSSEVQIAILTAKIRALALHLEAPKGNRDKHNKRNLRLLCHKRQRLLRYLERKERNSARWRHLLETLGLTPATWKRQISF
ncbi:hypothetical protein VTK73DRAFT_9971 [Phialemonium thermophilum]|uniref:Ribosomal protein S15 n=1 Tax=Phialemonium thermophilum TaxID=223376 RepID=A0ABR3VZ62_9PEZI